MERTRHQPGDASEACSMNKKIATAWSCQRRLVAAAFDRCDISALQELQVPYSDGYTQSEDLVVLSTGPRACSGLSRHIDANFSCSVLNKLARGKS